jgi:tetratricopeptide (TPR) repeat protein
MAADGATGVIAVATSIPPQLARRDAGRDAPDYQALCIQSWLANRFRVISVNHADEIPALAARYPQVTFVPTVRDARQWTGRKNPYIADLLLALKDADEPVLGLINSDLLFEPSSAWTEQLPLRMQGSMIVAHRYNTHSLRHGALRRFQGWDCFFFDHAMALHALENAMPFAIGAPWWDYWLPCLALLNDRRVTVIDRPVILHLYHQTAYSGDSQKDFGHAFAETIIRVSENRDHPLPVAAVLPMLHDIARHDLESAERKRRYQDISEIFESEIRKNVETWQASSSARACGADLSSAGTAFERLDQRLSAGDALKRIKISSAKKRPLEAGPELVEALKQTPEDADALLALADIFRRRGDFPAAVKYCTHAASVLPDSPNPLHGLGIVLHVQGRHEEALACFRRALEIEPAHQSSCINTAKTLRDMNRREEAIVFLDDVLARHPDLTQVAGFRHQLTNR